MGTTKPKESLRIRVLDALEARPMGISELARVIVASDWSVRPVVKQLLEANMIEQIDRGLVATNEAAQARIYAIKGSLAKDVTKKKGEAA